VIGERGTFLDRCLDFNVRVRELLAAVPGTAVTKEDRAQLASSASSIGANVSEAQSAQSHPDFISKLAIALKEARETAWWLALVQRLCPEPAELLTWLNRECYELTAILMASLKTARANGTAGTKVR
jgi:four helix bundle protein